MSSRLRTPAPMVVGTPASHAGVLARRAALQVAGYSLGIIIVVLAVLAGGMLKAPIRSHLPWLIAASAAIAVFGYFARSARISYDKASIGARSEKRVARSLATLPVTAVMNGILLGAGGDADHLVLGPVAIAIETKTGHGRVYTQGDRLCAGSRTIPGSPIGQVNRQARKLANILHVPISAIVCIVDMDNAPFNAGGVTVCSLADLTAVIRNCPAVLDPTRVPTIAKTLYDNHQRLEAAHDAAPHH